MTHSQEGDFLFVVDERVAHFFGFGKGCLVPLGTQFVA